MKTMLVFSIFVSLACTPIALSQPVSWLQTNGPTGGAIRTLLACNASGLICGTFGGGVFRSTDDGLTWISSTTGLTNRTILKVAQSGSGALFAGTYGDGVFRSLDNGNSWTQVLSPSFAAVWAISASDSGFIFASTEFSGIYRSTDNGLTWFPSNMGVSNNAVRSIECGSGNMVFAGTLGGGVYRSTNSGTSWIQRNSGLTIPYVRSLLHPLAIFSRALMEVVSSVPPTMVIPGARQR